MLKIYLVYFVWLFVIAGPDTTVANIGQLVTDRLIFILILSIVILVHGSTYVMGLATITKQESVKSNASLRSTNLDSKYEGI
jgi:hypothetical protein